MTKRLTVEDIARQAHYVYEIADGSPNERFKKERAAIQRAIRRAVALEHRAIRERIQMADSGSGIVLLEDALACVVAKR